jgi:hypothetical protein
MADANAPDAAAAPSTPTAAAAPAAAPAAPAPTAAAPAAPAPVPVATEDLKPSTPKIKMKKRTQRACDEKVEKGKLCCGHLKRWYDYPKEIEKLIGAKAEIYRCEFCKTLYKPDLSSGPHSYTLRY